MSRPARDDKTASLFRMLEDKIALERSFGVEVVPKPSPSSPEEEGRGLPAGALAKAGEGADRATTPAAKPKARAQLPADASKAERLAALAQEMAECHECPLGSTRTNLVFGVGSPEATLMFVGEAPGADEDAQGEPFVGRAGQLLTRIIIAMGLKREDVYIANILKCRPPGNRQPRPNEVLECIPYLRRQIRIIQPKLIVALGGVAAQNLLGTMESVGRLRNRWHEYEGIPLLVTFHPAYLLRNPNDKPQVWEDMKKVLHKLGLPIPSR